MSHGVFGIAVSGSCGPFPYRTRAWKAYEDRNPTRAEDPMPDTPPPGARTSPATARNRDPILEVLRPRLPAHGLVLEVASGAGEHAVHMARALPGLSWQPTDPDSAALDSIAAWRDAAGLPNLLAPLKLDAAAPESWPVEKADAMVCINMVHISPWAATEGLMAGAGRVLPPGGILYLYGPYREAGVETAPSNTAFDLDLKARNPAWGLRDLEAVSDLAARHGLRLDERIAMPADNLSLVFVQSGYIDFTTLRLV
jgi:SAM-dependent methyltransferase